MLDGDDMQRTHLAEVGNQLTVRLFLDVGLDAANPRACVGFGDKNLLLEAFVHLVKYPVGQ